MDGLTLHRITTRPRTTGNNKNRRSGRNYESARGVHELPELVPVVGTLLHVGVKPRAGLRRLAMRQTVLHNIDNKTIQGTCNEVMIRRRILVESPNLVLV